MFVTYKFYFEFWIYKLLYLNMQVPDQIPQSHFQSSKFTCQSLQGSSQPNSRSSIQTVPRTSIQPAPRSSSQPVLISSNQAASSSNVVVIHVELGGWCAMVS